MKGIVRRYLKDKGFGFIEVPNSPDHFFHIDDAINFTRDDVRIGMEVEFDSEDAPKGKRAYRVTA